MSNGAFCDRFDLERAKRVPEVKALVEAAKEMLYFHGVMGEGYPPEPVPCDCAECTRLRAALAKFEEDE